ncbi:phosphate acetyltransferase [Luteipulveratus flavus]|uniref:Phosphate acetyltransferase n=1 Tax=Luteipulveratus flavus TaxID=3031728 RepID=A0ABT6C1M4_9MICO|nr:phosphate acetyltransferase [Luteipulveratus sp. YIM 133296]MDF8262784.1 phosphate acetyltransferase [Luteipulveratus sp. YIM 133296]
MSRSVYITSTEGETGKSTIALGLLDLLSREAGRIGVFRAVTGSDHRPDPVVELLRSHAGIDQSYDESIGVTYDRLHTDEAGALGDIVDRFHRLAATRDVVIVLGSDFTDVSSGGEAAMNARIAANLGSPVVLVVQGKERDADAVAVAAELACEQLREEHALPVALIANRVSTDVLADVRERLGDLPAAGGAPLLGVLPEVPLLVAPTVRSLLAACDGELLRGNDAWLDREARGFVIAAMSMPNVLTRLVEDVTVIAPGDRYDVLPGLVFAHQSGTFPALSAIVLTGGYRPPDTILQLIDGSPSDLPIIVTDLGTFDTTTRLAGTKGALSSGSLVKRQTALRTFADAVDGDALLAAIDVADATAVTPLMFTHRLLARARSDRRRIVLPEGDDPRILRAADSLLRQGVADLVLLGDETALRAQASSAGLDISGATVLSPTDEEHVERYAKVYAELRAHKGMTVEKAREVVTDVSYFGTLMVHLGEADGMVSGAAHTTAHTIRPSFEIIRTVPGTSVVSSVFLMCLADRVLVYGDCAVNPDPTATELADIAISSAATAEQFGIDPRVAMLSYSTGTSGAGADVDKVRDATALVRERRPDLLVEGPIQYDAAVDADVARTKMPDSPVAGQATVLIFPDLNTGNNTYKAVQRSAGAVAVGPVLQGLNRPVNDLSRGALVDDIISTVAITAIQAQSTSTSHAADKARR